MLEVHLRFLIIITDRCFLEPKMTKDAFDEWAEQEG